MNVNVRRLFRRKRNRRKSLFYLSLRDQEQSVCRLDRLELVGRVGGAEHGVAVGGALDDDAVVCRKELRSVKVEVEKKKKTR